MDHPRLSKRMSELGLCSRRDADAWIANGWVRVDGRVVVVLGTRVAPDVRIEVLHAARYEQVARVASLLRLPFCYFSGKPEPGYRPAIVLFVADREWRDDRAPIR